MPRTVNSVVHAVTSKLEQTASLAKSSMRYLDARLVITSSARVPDATRWEFISKAGEPPVRLAPPFVSRKRGVKKKKEATKFFNK